MAAIVALDLKTAVGHIKQACDLSRPKLPFVFVVGAGVSHPPVPLAWEIEEECRNRANSYGRLTEPDTLTPMSTYSHWFNQAFPQPVQRQEYLRHLIMGKPISHANLRLAHVLLDHSIANIVITPNFDDYLSRALSLFGEPHIVCDHPHTSERIDAERPEIQVIHVHGTYWFYDCCNLSGEISGRASTHTMGSVLDSVFLNRSPLVIGYSGWEGDVVMAALKRRLSMFKPLPQNIYWFCYRKKDIFALPEWLQAHPNVVFVTPSKTAEQKNELEMTSILTSHLSRVKDDFSDKDVVKTDWESCLPATAVLDELIQAFDIKAPDLTTQPLRFFASQLKAALIVETGAADTDKYLLSQVVERVERASEFEQERVEQTQKYLDKVLEALRKSNYQETLDLASQIVVKNLDRTQLHDLLQAVFSAATNIGGRGGEALWRYNLVVSVGDELLLRGPLDPVLSEYMAKALLAKAHGLRRSGQQEQALLVYDSIMERFGNSDARNVQLEVGTACFYKAIALGSDFAKYDDALSLVNEHLPYYLSKAPNSPTVPDLFIAKALALWGKREYELALGAFDDVLRCTYTPTEPQDLWRLAFAQYQKGSLLEDMKRRDQAIDAYGQLQDRFAESATPMVRELVADGMLSHASLLSSLRRRQAALSMYDKLYELYGKSDEASGIRAIVAKALLRKGQLLMAVGRHKLARQVCDLLEKEYSGSVPQNSLDELKAAANRNHQGEHFANQAK